MKIFLAHASSFDYENKLYAPLRAFGETEGHEITLPHERGTTWNTKDAIAQSDVMLADVSLPSTGCGIEIGWAESAGVPIIAIHEEGSTPSTVVPFVATTAFSYTSSEHLIDQLKNALLSL